MYEQPYTHPPPGVPPPDPTASAPRLVAPAPAPGRRVPQGVLHAALAGVAGVALSVAGFVGEHAHPASAVRHWHAAMAAGDLTALRGDERLGARAWADELVRDLGTRDYERVLAIFDRARELGQSDFARLRDAAAAAGRSAFEALPWPEQQAIAQRSHLEWVYESGYPRVAEASAAGSWRALATDPPAADLVQRLGTAGLGADEQNLLANRAASDPAVAADPMLADLAARRTSEGESALRRLREQVAREGERAFRRLQWQAQREVDQRSRARYERERGFAALGAADRARLGGAEALEDETGAVAERLGRQQLPPAELREIAGRTRADFTAARERYVDSAGARLAQETLRREFGGSRFHYDGLDVVGAGGRDLIRRRTGRAELAWDQVGSGLRALPATVDLRWSSRTADWRIQDVQWRPRPGADAQARPGATSPQGAPGAAPPRGAAPGAGDEPAEGVAE